MSIARPLPLHTPPIPGEAWAGYLDRVADHLDVPRASLLGDALGRNPRDLRYWYTCAAAGVAATDTTFTALAAYFRLRPGQVRRMHLQVFAGSALHLRPEDIVAFDPAHGTPARQYPAHRFQALHQIRRPHGCPQCLRERPGIWPLTWRLRWHLACAEHHAMHVADPAGVAWSSIPAQVVTPELLECQRQILHRLTPRPGNRAYFTHLETNIRLRVGSRWCNVEPAHLAAVIPDAVAAIPDEGHPNLDAIARLRAHGRGKRGVSRLLTTPHPHQDLPRPPETYPQLLPTRHYVPDLSDLLYPTGLRIGRSVTATAVYMHATSVDAATAAAALHQPARTDLSLLDAVLRLRQAGRLEAFWAAIAQAAVAVHSDAIDYGRRRQLADRAEVRALASTAAPSADTWMLRTWVVDQWACTYTTPNERPSSRNGLIEVYDRTYGAAMRAALRHLETDPQARPA